MYKCMVFCCHDDEVEEEQTEIQNLASVLTLNMT